MRSKLKSNHCTKESVVVILPLRVQFEIDPALEDLPGLPPVVLQEEAPSLGLPAPDGNRVLAHSIHAEPPCSCLLNHPRLRKFDGSFTPLVPDQATVRGTRSPSLHDHASGVARQLEVTPGRQRSGSNDTVRSDEAVFGDTHNAADDSIMIVLDEPRCSSPVDVRQAPVQPQLHFTNRIGKRTEVPKLAIPGLAPAPADGMRCVARRPGIPSPPLTPSSKVKLSGPRDAQRRPLLVVANPTVSPSPTAVARGTPPSAKSTTRPMPLTPIKHQGRNPGVIRQAPNVEANQTKTLLPRSPRRVSPLDLDPVTVGGGKTFGVIGDHRPSKGRTQSQAVGEPKDKKSTPPVKVEPMLAPDRVDGERGSDDDPRPELIDCPAPIYVGGGRYYVGRYLGGGAMGRVYSVANRESMQLAALKVIKRKNLNSTDLSFVKGEWAILKAIGEAKLVGRDPGLQFVHSLLESWYDREHIYFAMVRSMDFFTSPVIYDWFLQPLCVGSLHNHLERTILSPSTIKVYTAELVR